MKKCTVDDDKNVQEVLNHVPGSLLGTLNNKQQSRKDSPLGLFTCSSLQGCLRFTWLMTLSFPLLEGGLSGEAVEQGGAAEVGLEPPLQILDPVGAGESFQLRLRGLDS